MTKSEIENVLQVWRADAQERAEKIQLQTMLALAGEQFGKQTLTKPKTKAERIAK